MTIREFIKTNRLRIDGVILHECPDVKLNDVERRLWILNDENLYRWARSEGVKI